MTLFAPAYYQKFKCIAAACTHSCCVGWEIDVDGDTLQKYATLSGALGHRLQTSLEAGEDGVHFALCPDGRCPHLDDSGLCEIIKQLGEGYLCEICREHPRFYNWVGERLECGVGASCEAAAALILAEDYTEILPLGEEECAQNHDTCAEFDAISARKRLYAVLSDRTVPYQKRLALIEAYYALPVPSDPQKWKAVFAALEYLDEAHKALFVSCLATSPERATEQEVLCERFLAYLIYRHASPAEDELSFRTAVGSALVMERLFAALLANGQPPIRAAVTVSEELEYSLDNTEAIGAALLV